MATDPARGFRRQTGCRSSNVFGTEWKHETCSLSAYAGQTVLLAFRAFNDPATLGADDSIEPGFWIDNVELGRDEISDGSTLSGWKSFTETRPHPVSNYTV